MKFTYLMSIAFCLCINFSLFCMEMPPSSKPLFEFVKKDITKKPGYYSKFFQYFNRKQKSFDEKSDTSVFQDWVDNTVYHYCGLNNFNMDQFQYVLNEIKAKYPEGLKKNRDLPEFLAHFNTKTQTLSTEAEPDDLEEINTIPINGPTKKKRKFMANPQLAFAIQTIEDNKQVFQKFIFEKIKAEPLLLNSVLFNNMVRDIKLVLHNKIQMPSLIEESSIHAKCFYPYTFPKETAQLFKNKLNKEQNNKEFPYIIKEADDHEIIIIKKGSEPDSFDYVELAFAFNGSHLKPINLPDQLFIDKEKLTSFIENILLNPYFSLNKLHKLAYKIVSSPESEPYKPKIKNFFFESTNNTQQISELFKIFPLKTNQKNINSKDKSKNWESNLSFSIQDKPLILQALKQQLEELQKKLPLSVVTLQEQKESAIINIVDNISIPLLGNLNKFDSQNAKQPISIKINFIEEESGIIHKKWDDKEINAIEKNPETTIITEKITFSDNSDIGAHNYTNLISGIEKHLFEDIENLIKNDKNSQIKKNIYNTFSFNNQATIATLKAQQTILSLISNGFDKLVQALAIELVQTHQEELNNFCISFGLLAQIINAQKKLNQTKKELALGDKKLTDYTTSIKQLQNTNLKKLSAEQQKKLYDDCIATLESQFAT